MVGNGGNHLQICYVFYTTSAKSELTFTTRVPSFIRKYFTLLILD